MSDSKNPAALLSGQGEAFFKALTEDINTMLEYARENGKELPAALQEDIAAFYTGAATKPDDAKPESAQSVVPTPPTSAQGEAEQ